MLSWFCVGCDYSIIIHILFIYQYHWHTNSITSPYCHTIIPHKICYNVSSNVTIWCVVVYEIVQSFKYHIQAHDNCIVTAITLTVWQCAVTLLRAAMSSCVGRAARARDSVRVPRILSCIHQGYRIIYLWNRIIRVLNHHMMGYTNSSFRLFCLYWWPLTISYNVWTCDVLGPDTE